MRGDRLALHRNDRETSRAELGGVLYCLKGFFKMSEAMRLIVSGYVKLRARKELDDLKAGRCRMATELKSCST